MDGYNQDLFNKEKNRLKEVLTREVSDYIYNISAKKQRWRSSIIKRYQNANQKVQGLVNYKIESKLRILRSYRIKLMHLYCKDVLKEVYADSIKIQVLQTC